MNQLKKHQTYLKQMLEEIITIFDKFGINYFLIGGTLLGSIRHKGFIPWDDDIDIGMHREDYNKFIRIGNDILPKHYSFKTKENDKKFNYFFGKIYDERTTLIEKTQNRIINGIYIDVFPFDRIDNDINKAKKRLKKIKIKRKLYNLKTGYFNENKNNWLVKISRPIANVFINEKRLENKIKKLSVLNKNIDTKYYANYFGAWGTKELVHEEWIKNTIIGQFEGLNVKLPIGHLEILERLYGDFMKLPEEGNRISHHNIEYISFDESYHKFIEKKQKEV